MAIWFVTTSFGLTGQLHLLLGVNREVLDYNLSDVTSHGNIDQETVG